MNNKHFLDLVGSLLFRTAQESINLQTPLRQLNEWNVLWVTSLLMMINEEFQVSLDDKDINDSYTVEDLLNRVVSKRKYA